jgi:hypothetical protein
MGKGVTVVEKSPKSYLKKPQPSFIKDRRKKMVRFRLQFVTPRHAHVNKGQRKES